MQSPKDPSATLVEEILSEGLTVLRCPTTGGVWIERSDYLDWQGRCAIAAPAIEEVAQRLSTLSLHALPQDNRVVLCPKTGRFLIRGRVDAPTPFYVDRSPDEWNFWLDRGEWEILMQLGLHGQLDLLFSPQWQAQLRECRQAQQQRWAIIDKLGAELAQRVFELAEELRQHPEGDCGVAYLMQQFERAERSEA